MTAVQIPCSSVFRGDHEEMVDHLIFASNKHKVFAAPLPGFGRELQPYFSADEELPNLPTRQFQSCGSPPRSSAIKPVGKLSRKAASPPDQRRSKDQGMSKHVASAVDLRSATNSKSGKGAIAVPTTAPGRKSMPGFASSPFGSSPPTCPAYFSSPKPEALPMPTTGLLSKAGSVKRQVSPADNDIFFPGSPSNGLLVPTAAA